jgi:DNA-binding response OmpR family regulator
LTSAPIVICSARQGHIDRALGVKVGAADFGAKPFELDDLEARVAAVLRASRQPDQPPPTDEIQVWPHGHRTKPRMRRDLRSAGTPDSE